jgi:hypothetical protein
MGVLPPKELSQWRVWKGMSVPTEDTHESVVFVLFLIQGLGLPVSSFFCSLLDYYFLNLAHLNPNFVLQIAIFSISVKIFLGLVHILDCGDISITIS